MTLSADIKKLERKYIPTDFTLTSWEDVKPYFIQLQDREINHVSDLKQWLADLSELQAVISEDACWRQIKMTCDTENKSLEEAFTFFCLEIEPHIKPWIDILNRKLMACPFVSELDPTAYFVYLRSVENEIKLFNEKNIPLHAEVNVLSQQYGAITGKLSIMHDQKEYTLQQASKFLMQSNRSLREEIYTKVNNCRLEHQSDLNELFNQLVAKRHQIAQNAGFENYRDYKFQELGRFDYTVDDCSHFHEAIKKYILPIVEEIYDHKRKLLNVETLMPYDIDAEPQGQVPLEPFTSGGRIAIKINQGVH
jgi:oligoendopeptidase F